MAAVDYGDQGDYRVAVRIERQHAAKVGWQNCSKGVSIYRKLRKPKVKTAASIQTSMGKFPPWRPQPIVTPDLPSALSTKICDRR